MFLIHMPSRDDLRVRFAQFNCVFRIAFQINPEDLFIQPCRSKHLAHHLKHQGDFVKRKGLFHSFFRQAIPPESFYVHSAKLTSRIILIKVYLVPQNMKIVITGIIFALATSASVVHAQLHEDVFPGLEGTDLEDAVQDAFTPGVILTYSEARNKMFEEIYNVNDTVTCVYSGHQRHLPPGTPSPIQFLLDNNSNIGINTEHTFPQSQGAGSGNPRANLYHLFPARVRVNEARGSLPFSEINDPQTETWYYKTQAISSIPGSLIDLYSEKKIDFFEPREDHKGNVARAMFYFYTIYRNVANAGFFNGQVETLCDWHLQDPVDSVEWDRNDMIATYQENKKNPFILDCTIAKRLYCPNHSDCQMSTSTFAPELTHGIKIIPNPAVEQISITTEPGVSIAIVSLMDHLGRKFRLYQVGEHQYRVDHLAKGLYFLEVVYEEGSKRARMSTPLVIQ